MSSLPVLLLVEDEELILLDVEEILHEAGFETVSASTGELAIKEIDADCTRFAALVTDINTGSGPTGWEIARRARHHCPNMPVVYISGDSTLDWSSEGVPKSVMLSKPFAPAQLVTAVATLINEATPADPW